MEKSFLILLLISLGLAGCGDDTAKDPGSDPIIGPTGTQVVKLLTSGDTFKQTFTNGTQFGGVHSTNIERLTSFLNEQAANKDLIESLDCVSLNSLDDFGTDGYRYLTVGSSSASGSLTVNSKYHVSNVKVECINYHKGYEGGGYNCDRDSHLLIDEDDNSLEIGATEEPSVQEFEKDYDDDGVTSFTISNSSGRVFIKSLTITYKAV